MRSVHLGPSVRIVATVVGLQAVGLAGVDVVVGLGARGWTVGLAWALAVGGGLARGLPHSPTGRLGPADRVTGARAVLIGGVAALVADAVGGAPATWAVVAVSAVALVLDGVDGAVARRTGTASALGARFDMECDAFLILVLSVAAIPVVGSWVLAIGLARYVFFAAGRLLPWLARPVPYRYWRKVVAAVQGVVLTIVVSRTLPPVLATAIAAVALALLAESFGRDVVWLARRRGDDTSALDDAGQTSPARTGR